MCLFFTFNAFKLSSASAETCEEEGPPCSLSLAAQCSSARRRAVSEIIYRRMAAARRLFGFFCEPEGREGRGRATDKKRLMRKRDNVCFFDCFFSLFFRKDNEMKMAAAPNERGEEERGRDNNTTQQGRARVWAKTATRISRVKCTLHCSTRPLTSASAVGP